MLYDPKDAATIADPYPALAHLRRHDPVHWSDRLGGWVLTRFDDVKRALNDRSLSADRITPFLDHLDEAERVRVANLGEMMQRWAVFRDPPDHTRLRGLMNKAFTGRALEVLVPRIETIVDTLLDDLIRQGSGGREVDFIKHFAYPLPATVIAAMVGVPDVDLDRFKSWSDDLAAFVGSAQVTPDKYDRAEAAVADMTDFFTRISEERRARPAVEGDGTIIDALIAAEDRGDVLSESELVACCVLLLFAGHETTTNLFGSGLHALFRHPEVHRDLRSAPEKAEAAVEEFLRYNGPIGAMTRIVAAPCRYGERDLKPGQRVFCMIHAANRDPAVFPDPDRLNIDRPENRHVVFGYGIHFCIGAPLARLEGRIAFDRLMRRTQAIAPAEADPPWNDSLVLRGLLRLPVSITAA